ncbi:MAG: hypothetical protein ACYCS8_10620 [Acidithiobacillus sp.]
MNDDDLLGGLNALVNQADKKPAAAKPVQRPAQPVAASPVEEDILSQQILERLDGIKASIDALKDTQPQVPKPAPEAKPATVDLKKPIPETKTPPRPSLPPVTRPDPVQPQVKSWWPYLVLVSAALELAAFAMGMGYGAVVASGKFPFWYKPGASGALVDWIAAPAGVLLLPIIAALLAMGGRELQREGHATVAKALWAIAGGLAVISALVPFIA